MNNQYYSPLPQQPAQPMQPSFAKQKAAKQLTQVIDSAHEVLASAKTVFPFTLFPDFVVLDRTKLTITTRSFFMVGEVVSLRIQDILNVTADVGPFFGSLKIWTRYFNNNDHPYEVHWMWRSDALKISRIMQGYLIALKNKVDCTPLSSKELAQMLDQLGRGAPRHQEP